MASDENFIFPIAILLFVYVFRHFRKLKESARVVLPEPEIPRDPNFRRREMVAEVLVSALVPLSALKLSEETHDSCAVCLSALDDPDILAEQKELDMTHPLILMPCCKKILHAKCAVDWAGAQLRMQKAPACPLCRSAYGGGPFSEDFV